MFKKIKNINSVAFYESKLLGRSWFFRIFALLLLAIGTIIILSAEEMIGFFTIFKNFPGTLVCFLCLPINVLQSIVIIFLSADYLKRDKQLDTSEVFYVRPLSNAEYLLGKMWGTLTSFITLDIILLTIFFCLSKFVAKVDVTPWEFLEYFAIIMLPSIVFIVGMSTAIMLLIGNQALTFVLMLGIAALSLFYVGELFYNIFDMFVYEIPLYKSKIIGYTNFDFILSHRLIYISIGISCILLSIFMFKRLAGSNIRRYQWLVLSLALFGVSAYWAYDYFLKSTEIDREREQIIALNDKYISYPKLLVDDYNIDVEHNGNSISSKVSAKGIISKDGDKLVFTLNSGMKLDSLHLSSDNTPLKFERNRHLIVANLPKQHTKGDTLSLNFVYNGNINQYDMFIDIRDEVLERKNETIEGIVQIDKKGAIIRPEWVVLTPESYWYPLSGVTYTNSTPNWQSNYFSNYTIKVKPMAGMIPVSQGEPKILADSVSYQFTTSNPLRAVSLAISDYEKLTINADSMVFSAYIHKKNFDRFKFFEPLKDTIPQLLKEIISDLEREVEYKYDSNRFTAVDVPEQIFSYQRDWSSTQELMQPEISFYPSAGVNNFYFENHYEWQKQAMERGWMPQMSDTLIKINLFKDLRWKFVNKDNIDGFEREQMGQIKINETANPYYIGSVMFNNDYNIYSENYSWASRLIEQYIFKNDIGNNWTRGANGLSNTEQALILLSEDRADKYLSNPKYASIMNDIISVMGNTLFAEIQSKIGVEEFKELIISQLENNKYKNINFEVLIDSISSATGVDVNEKLKLTEQKLNLPAFYIRKVTEAKYESDENPIFVYEYEVKNLTDTEGYLEFFLRNREKEVSFVVRVGANETKRIVKHMSTEHWRPRVSTMNSYNLPQFKDLMFSKEKLQKTPPAEGEFIIKDTDIFDENEIIIDNENEELFSVSEAPKSGYLNAWIDKSMENDFKYKGVWGRTPFRWTAVTDEKYYGDAILSAYIIRSGDGEQKVTWKIPIKEAGRYGFYCTASFPRELRWMRRSGGKVKPTYDFTINTGDREDNIEVDLTNLNRRSRIADWLWINDYNVKADTVIVTLSNKTDLWSVTADAVKAVKLD